MMTKGKKKALIITLSIVGVLIIAIAVTLAVLFTRKPEQPVASEGAIYQTESKIIWSGVAGVAYISFEYVEEPAVPEDGTLYGYVFKVMADGSTDVTKCTPWLSGKWELEENNGVYGTLTLTATWDNEDSNSTKLTDATSGEPKTYSLENGEYKIGISFSAGADLMFTLNPVTDKVGEDQTTKPTPPCTTGHVDADGDGKCDNCGADMPTETPDEPELMLTMTATDAITMMTAKIEMYNDNTFAFILDMMGGKVFGGTWESSDTTGQNPMAPLTLTADETGSAVVGDTITVTITPSADYSSMTYTCHVDYVVPDTITMAFDFTGEYIVEPSAPEEPELMLTMTATDAATTMTAKIEMYDDNTFAFILDMMGGKVFGGTWGSSDTSGQNPMAPLTLTVDETGSSVVGETLTVTITPAEDYSSMTYTCHVDYVVPDTITMSFDFTGTFAVGA